MSHTSKLHWYAAASKQDNDVYELWNDEQRLLTLYFNQFSQTAKVECEDSRRNFKIEKEGFLRNKTILKNEYGVKVGELGPDNWFSQDGFIDLNGERFHYTTQTNNLAELIIFKSSKKHPLLICGLTNNNGEPSVHFEKSKETGKYSCLLMALSWFMLMPIAKAYVVQHAF